MAAKVAFYQIPGHKRSKLICEAMTIGIRKIGDQVKIVPAFSYNSPDEFDVAVFYGLEGRLERIIREYPKAGRTSVYVDLGYWGRHAGGRWTGYHKVSVNGRHPTDYFQVFKHPSNRLDRFGILMRPWRGDGRHILLAGMGDKAARAEGFKAEEWERRTLAEIQQHTDRPILYRPKPSWKDAGPIEGAEFSPQDDDISAALANCHAIVTHHSNVGVDGLVAGIPVFSWEGVASVLAGKNLEDIENPPCPDGREQWAADIAYTQWSIKEMAAGLPWRHMKSEGLVP